MKLEDYRKDYYAFSTKASELGRQLSFAGIAFIWIFKLDKGGPIAVPTALQLPALLFGVALALDLLHAIWGTLIWGAFSRYHEWKDVKDEDELDSPAWFNWPTLLLFWGKLLVVLTAYLCLGQYVYCLLRAP